MALHQRVLSLTNRKREDDELIKVSHVICKTYGWSYEMLMETPIPFIHGMIEQLNAEAREQEKANKKAGRKR